MAWVCRVQRIMSETKTQTNGANNMTKIDLTDAQAKAMNALYSGVVERINANTAAALERRGLVTKLYDGTHALTSKGLDWER